ncbi:MAG: PIN domain-containing protein [Clostridiales bacterium]|jgi:predicted nucleic acid-binding protein|nr:PIN domain-containing protein [Clostridiales bacterium]
MIYALDTNIISYILNGNGALDYKLNEIVPINEVIIPLFVYYEVRRGLIAKQAERKLRAFERLCLQLDIVNLTVHDMNTASKIYAERKAAGTVIDDGDLLIAAQCVTNGYVLVTNNIKHFRDINNFRYENWLNAEEQDNDF